MCALSEYLAASQARHSHLCPRQVLGVRIALAGLDFLAMPPPSKQPRNLLVISETNGCFVDGIEVTAHVSVGHRSLKIEDYGKLAATFIDTKTGQALRLRPVNGARRLAATYFPRERRAYFAQLKGYQVIPDSELLHVERVTLKQELQRLLGSRNRRACCSLCGEEIINGRELIENDLTLCVACAGKAYYRLQEETQKTNQVPSVLR